MSESDAKAVPTTPVETLGAGTIWLIVLGAAAAVAGAISGVVLALHRTVVPCPDGTVIDSNADPNCYSYYDAALGVSIMFACAALLLLIGLATRILVVVSRSGRAQAQLD